jgi:hypothetical protein
MEALTGGELKLSGNCLIAGNHILVWPYGFKATKCGDTVFVYNGEGKRIFRTGDTIRVGGGEAGDISLLNNGQVELPANICKGTAWIVGEIVSGR